MSLVQCKMALSWQFQQKIVSSPLTQELRVSAAAAATNVDWNSSASDVIINGQLQVLPPILTMCCPLQALAEALSGFSGSGSGSSSTNVSDHFYSHSNSSSLPYPASSSGVQDFEFYYRHGRVMNILYCVAYSIVFLVGIIGNSFVIAVVLRSPRMRTVTNYFIVNLAVADFLVIIFCLPATLMSNIFVRKYCFSRSLCCAKCNI